MKHLTLDAQDNSALEEIGRASVQIVHDIKNQLNGLKLYATFLRKRMERRDAPGPPADELETVTKLIAGLDRATSDAAALVRYGRPLELRRQPHVSLVRILSHAIATDEFNEASDDVYEGEFDSASLGEALKDITTSARLHANAAEANSLRVYLTRDESNGAAIIEWRPVKLTEGEDPFRSFAGSDALRLAMAARVIEAHGGETGYDASTLRIRLPLTKTVTDER